MRIYGIRENPEVTVFDTGGLAEQPNITGTQKITVIHVFALSCQSKSGKNWVTSRRNTIKFRLHTRSDRTNKPGVLLHHVLLFYGT